MNIIVLEKAKQDLAKMDASLREFFLKHFEKLETNPPGRHLRFGLPFNVENVTKQARFVYEIESDILYIVRCFATHKEYEKWYRSFK
ncbi:hypothetical protein HY991_03975 [Candidatus Micrarchaeota archaeon]|nr:hypothetical protein [Candidatus Micrarchaeota archaeon]